MRLVTILFCFVIFLLPLEAKRSKRGADYDYTSLPDKAFIHLDKNLYAQGDTIWAKAYVFHRNNQELSDNSYSLHIQILNDAGRQVSTYKMLIVDGMGYGQMPVYDTFEPGLYQLIAHTDHMKNYGNRFFFKTQFEVCQKKSDPILKVFLDKEEYRLRDTARVTFKAYTGSHRQIELDRLYVKLCYDDKVLKKGGLKPNSDGTAQISLPLMKGTKNDPMRLEITWFKDPIDTKGITQTVYFPMADEKVYVNFFPEGGTILMGKENRVAFEAVGRSGEPIEIEGVLLENGRKILSTSTIHDGMGSFTFKPRKAKYVFKVTKPVMKKSVKKFPTVIRRDGYLLAYARQDEDHVYVRVAHNFDKRKTINLWMSQNDKLFKTLSLSVPKEQEVALPKNELPEGLITITLVDGSQVPQAERMVYVQGAKRDIDITVSQDIYKKRDSVSLSLQVNNDRIPGHFSVAVVDSLLGNSLGVKRTDIKSYTLLETEVKGNFNNLSQYLKRDEITEINRNLLLMINGWRKYSWIENEQQIGSSQIGEFNRIEGSLNVDGEPGGGKLIATVVGDTSSTVKFRANRHGDFKVTPNYEDLALKKVLIKPYSEKHKGQYEIFITNTDTLLFSVIANRYSEELERASRFANREIDKDVFPFKPYECEFLRLYEKESEFKKREEKHVRFASADKISGDKIECGRSFACYVKQASSSIVYDFEKDRLMILTLDFFGTEEDEDLNKITVKNDGAEVYLDDVRWGKSVNQMNFLTREDIEEIIVLDRENALGDNWHNGTILVNTYNKNYLEFKEPTEVEMAIFDGFIDAKEFYQPMYSKSQVERQIPFDHRVTLHWEPFVETDSSGVASLNFSTSDLEGAKQIVVQGIDDEGNLFFETGSFEVK